MATGSLKWKDIFGWIGGRKQRHSWVAVVQTAAYRGQRQVWVPDTCRSSILSDPTATGPRSDPQTTVHLKTWVFWKVTPCRLSKRGLLDPEDWSETSVFTSWHGVTSWKTLAESYSAASKIQYGGLLICNTLQTDPHRRENINAQSKFLPPSSVSNWYN